MLRDFSVVSDINVPRSDTSFEAGGDEVIIDNISPKCLVCDKKDSIYGDNRNNQKCYDNYYNPEFILSVIMQGFVDDFSCDPKEIIAKYNRPDEKLSKTYKIV